jgi:hypothetical protein
LTGVGNVTVTLDGSTVKISGVSAGGGTPAGSDRQIQFNDGGSFGADSQLFFDTSVAAQLFVSGAGGNAGSIDVLSSDTQEGGQITLYGATSYAGKNWTIDAWQDKFRIFSGALPYLQISDRSLQLLDGTTKVSLNVNGDSYLNGGNIGIGTSSPSRQMHSLSASNNYFRLETDNVNGYAGIEFENDAKTWTLGVSNSDDFVLANAASFGGGYPITVKNGAYSNQLYLASAGKIGINNDPQAALDIYSSGQTALDVHTADQNYFTCQLFNDTYGTASTAAHQLLMLNNGTLTWYLPDNGSTPGNIEFYSRDTSSYVMTLDADNARVGIGTSSPSAKLHVVGNIAGQAISGTSFHGSHFVSAPYSIGATSGAITIDFDNGSAQYATLNGNVTSFAASNVEAGESVVVQFTTTSARTIAPGSTLAFIGEHPTALSANMTGILSLMSFDGSTVVAGFAVQTGVA